MVNVSRYEPSLSWIDEQHPRMCRLVKRWADINSGTHNLAGLERVSVDVSKEFQSLGGSASRIASAPYRAVDTAGRVVEHSLADALLIRKRPDAAIRIFLGIHIDTVYAADQPFQQTQEIDERTLRGPGVVDAKGGLCVMLVALEALERSPFADKIGWEILLNTDEEIGSPGSADLLKQCAARNQIGLVYEPALPDGNLVGERWGSGNFDAIVRGRSAHVGRDFQSGRSAIYAAAKMIAKLEALSASIPGIVVNVGRIDGGGPSNVVPELAIVRFNVRVPDVASQKRVEAELQQIVERVRRRDGIGVELSGGFHAPPKLMDTPTRQLFGDVIACGREIGLNLSHRSSGGVSDGNRLAAAGLPVIDTLGPRGGNLHSPEEFLALDSLTERAKLSALLLMKLASGELSPPSKAERSAE